MRKKPFCKDLLLRFSKIKSTKRELEKFFISLEEKVCDG